MCTFPLDDLRFSNTTGILPKKKTVWFIGVEVEQEASAPPPKKSWIRPWQGYAADATMQNGVFFDEGFRLNLKTTPQTTVS